VRHLDAVAEFARSKSRGMRGRDQLFERVDQTRRLLARLLDCQPAEIGFPYSVADGMNLLAGSLDLGARDNVVLERWEFPSVLYPWLEQRRHRGVEVRLVEPEPGGWQAPLERWRALVDDRTRLVAVSHVSYLTGERHDLAALAQLAHDAGALLVVDATHALGAVPVHAPHVDCLFSACYKWVLGTHGLAIAYWNRQRLPDWRPKAAGWHSIGRQAPWQQGGDFELLDDARVFEAGNPGFAAIYILHSALDYLLAVGVEPTARHVIALGGALHQGLVELGLQLLTPPEPDRRAGNVAFEVADELAWRRELEKRDVLAWTGDGRVRLSTHLFNDTSDVERAVANDVLERGAASARHP
jgi:cysteine desulfurase / selenocysteine lyase